MQGEPIKRELRDLSLDELRIKKDEIGLFLFNHPGVENAGQGEKTIDALSYLIKFKEQKDEFAETVVKELFFA